MGRDPKGIYNTEMDVLNSLVTLLTWDLGSHPELSAYGLLPFLKKHTMGNLKIKTIKICFVLDNDVHMHKDIFWEDL